MAGIEKICEYSGDYEAHIMYKDKKNFIQVLRKHWDAFRNVNAVLVFFREPELMNYVGDGPNAFVTKVISIGNFYKIISFPRFWSSYYWFWKKYGHVYDIPTRLWNYCVYIPDRRGEVDGKYYNWTTDPQKAIKKICRWMNIVAIESYPCSLEDAQRMEERLWKDIDQLYLEAVKENGH